MTAAGASIDGNKGKQTNINYVTNARVITIRQVNVTATNRYKTTMVMPQLFHRLEEHYANRCLYKCRNQTFDNKNVGKFLK
jgi:hypothetical protein